MGMAIGRRDARAERRRRGVPRYGAMADINMTPFIDVMLVLLIIFMVAAPLLTTGVAVDLPQTKAGPLNIEQKPVSITHQRSGAASPDGSRRRRRRPDRQIARVRQGRLRTQRIYLRAAKIIPYGRVAEIMASMTAGYKKVALVTEPD